MLGSDRETILVGMQLLKVVLEECVSREGVTARRAAELLSLVSAEVSEARRVFNLCKRDGRCLPNGLPGSCNYGCA